MVKKDMRLLTGILVLLGFLGVVSTAPAADIQYEITVTNLMHGEQTPPFPCNTGEFMGLFFFAAHGADVKLFTLGEPARPGLALLAESGRALLLGAGIGE